MDDGLIVFSVIPRCFLLVPNAASPPSFATPSRFVLLNFGGIILRQVSTTVALKLNRTGISDILISQTISTVNKQMDARQRACGSVIQRPCQTYAPSACEI